MNNDVCPRFYEDGGNLETTNYKATQYAGYTNRPGRGLCCNYCGSLHPDTFMEQVRAGEELSVTDKDYKAYMQGRSKFYFQHLSTEQRHEFIDLVNDGTVRFDWPGHFTVSPFFMRLAE